MYISSLTYVICASNVLRINHTLFIIAIKTFGSLVQWVWSWSHLDWWQHTNPFLAIGMHVCCVVVCQVALCYVMVDRF